MYVGMQVCLVYIAIWVLVGAMYHIDIADRMKYVSKKQNECDRHGIPKEWN